ncbi:helix-turn-helix domain-containing protein [Candidatus Poribacteria bacterium]|nr:helix-turn-helix domain-containing protein [Candidatus Poribacteria bacterium]
MPMSVVTDNMTEHLSTQQAAKYFNVHERTIRRWIKSGKLPAELIEGRWFVQIADENVQGNGQPVMGNARNNGQDAESRDRLYEHLSSEIRTLREQLTEKDNQINHIQQIVAMSQKNIGALTEQLDDSRQMIEDMRQRKTVWQQLKAVFVAESA